jgi:hypothetical protein
VSIVALVIVAIVWYTSSRPATNAPIEGGASAGPGTTIAGLIGAGGALIGGIVDASESGNSGQTARSAPVEA